MAEALEFPGAESWVFGVENGVNSARRLAGRGTASGLQLPPYPCQLSVVWDGLSLFGLNYGAPGYTERRILTIPAQSTRAEQRRMVTVPTTGPGATIWFPLGTSDHSAQLSARAVIVAYPAPLAV